MIAGFSLFFILVTRFAENKVALRGRGIFLFFFLFLQLLESDHQRAEDERADYYEATPYPACVNEYENRRCRQSHREYAEQNSQYLIHIIIIQ